MTLTKTKKMRLLRQKSSVKNNKKERKKKFGRETTKDNEGEDLSPKEEANRIRKTTLKIGQIVIYIDCVAGSFSSVLGTPVNVPQGLAI